MSRYSRQRLVARRRVAGQSESLQPLVPCQSSAARMQMMDARQHHARPSRMRVMYKPPLPGERGDQGKAFSHAPPPRHTTSRQKHVTPEAPRFLDAGSLAVASCCELLHVASSHAAPGGPGPTRAKWVDLSHLWCFLVSEESPSPTSQIATKVLKTDIRIAVIGTTFGK